MHRIQKNKEAPFQTTKAKCLKAPLHRDKLAIIGVTKVFYTAHLCIITSVFFQLKPVFFLCDTSVICNMTVVAHICHYYWCQFHHHFVWRRCRTCTYPLLPIILIILLDKKDVIHRGATVRMLPNTPLLISGVFWYQATYEHESDDVNDVAQSTADCNSILSYD